MITGEPILFTGIVESFGTVRKIAARQEGRVLTISTDMDLSGSRVGDSIAVNGACLTATRLEPDVFDVDMAPETVDRTTFKHAKAGMRVNLERALRLSDRIDGHLVSGHIDGTGTIVSLKKRSNALIIRIGAAGSLMAEMIEKGSVAVDGISLTINSCSDTDFEVSVIPHTAQATTLGLKSPGDEVNIETDMIGKYIRKMLQQATGASGAPMLSKGVDLDLLARNGFL